MANRKYLYDTDGPMKDIAARYPGGLNIQVPKSPQQQAKDLLGQINNRPGFQYDPSTDPLWQNIRNQYVHNGQRAMEDTMGQAAGLTGGYGSTYAQGVGQQAYNEYLLGLNGELATAYDRARTAYDAETADLYNRYNLALGAAQDQYNRGRDALADERYNAEWAQQQQAYADDQAYREWQMRQAELDRQDQQNKQNQSMAYEMVMNMISTGQTPPAELLAQAGVSGDYARSMAGYYAQQAALAAAGSGGSSGGSGGGSSRGSGSGSGSGSRSSSGRSSGGGSSRGSGSGSGSGSGNGNISDAERQQILDYLLENGEQKGQNYLQRYANYDNFDAVRQWIIAEYNKRKRQEALNAKPKGNGGGGTGTNNRDNRLN